MESCKNWAAKCIICTRPHKVDKHQYGVINCVKGSGKVCAHVIIKCANSGDSQMANFLHYILRRKAGVKANKKRKLRKHNAKRKKKAISED